MVYDSVSQIPLFQKPFSTLKVMMDAYIKTENHKKWEVSEIENGCSHSSDYEKYYLLGCYSEESEIQEHSLGITVQCTSVSYN
jgi:hypothetical protein